MNIREAEREIRQTVEVYLEKKACGEYVIPFEKQRPIVMMGPPGIGKSSIVREIAGKMGIALVVCSAAHYTRQGAFGRALIKEKKYDDRQYSVLEYTMGEILSAICKVMECSGKREGILFMDDINCAAETLTPSIYQLLQYKMLGNCRIPEGWVIVAAGSMPGYSQMTRNFPVSVWDRVKRLDVEADYMIWKKYAFERDIHSSVVSFLEKNPDRFYSVQVSGNRSRYVTARGWENLSEAIQAYERKGFSVDQNLIFQYITVPEIVKQFEQHYKLFLKYKKDYPEEQVLNEKMLEKLLKQVSRSETDQKMILRCYIAETLHQSMGKNLCQQKVLKKLEEYVHSAEEETVREDISLSVILESMVEQLETEEKKKRQAHCLLNSEKTEYQKLISYLKLFLNYSLEETGTEEQIQLARQKLNQLMEENNRKQRSVTQLMNIFSNIFDF